MSIGKTSCHIYVEAAGCCRQLLNVISKLSYFLKEQSVIKLLCQGKCGNTADNLCKKKKLKKKSLNVMKKSHCEWEPRRVCHLLMVIMWCHLEQKNIVISVTFHYAGWVRWCSVVGHMLSCDTDLGVACCVLHCMCSVLCCVCCVLCVICYTVCYVLCVVCCAVYCVVGAVCSLLLAVSCVCSVQCVVCSVCCCSSLSGSRDAGVCGSIRRD